MHIMIYRMVIIIYDVGHVECKIERGTLYHYVHSFWSMRTLDSTYAETKPMFMRIAYELVLLAVEAQPNVTINPRNLLNAFKIKRK